MTKGNNAITDVKEELLEGEVKPMQNTVDPEGVTIPKYEYLKDDINIPEFLSKKKKTKEYPVFTTHDAISLMITKKCMFGIIIVALFFGIFSGAMVTSVIYQTKINEMNMIHTQQLLEQKSTISSLEKELSDSKTANLAMANKLAFVMTKTYPAVKKPALYMAALTKIRALPEYKKAPKFVQKFLDRSIPQAIAAAKKTGLKYPSIALAQGMEESGNGKFAIGGYNIFGMKGSSSRGSVIVRTKDIVKGKTVSRLCKFQKFNSYEEAFIKHAENLLDHGAYRKFRKAKNYKEAARALEGTYASNPSYSENLIYYIQTYHLYELDKELKQLL